VRWVAAPWSSGEPAWSGSRLAKEPEIQRSGCFKLPQLADEKLDLGACRLRPTS